MSKRIKHTTFSSLRNHVERCMMKDFANESALSRQLVGFTDGYLAQRSKIDLRNRISFGWFIDAFDDRSFFEASITRLRALGQDMAGNTNSLMKVLYLNRTHNHLITRHAYVTASGCNYHYRVDKRKWWNDFCNRSSWDESVPNGDYEDSIRAHNWFNEQGEFRYSGRSHHTEQLGPHYWENLSLALSCGMSKVDRFANNVVCHKDIGAIQQLTKEQRSFVFREIEECIILCWRTYFGIVEAFQLPTTAISSHSPPRFEKLGLSRSEISELDQNNEQRISRLYKGINARSLTPVLSANKS